MLRLMPVHERTNICAAGWPKIARVAKVIFSNIIALPLLRALHEAHPSQPSIPHMHKYSAGQK